jgi:hypothetical protein
MVYLPISDPAATSGLSEKVRMTRTPRLQGVHLDVAFRSGSLVRVISVE